MSDAICLKCQEPWDLHYLGHEAMWDFPGAHAPKYILDLHHKLMKDDEDAFNMSQKFEPAIYAEYGGELLTKAILKGEGCPTCWDDRARQVDDVETELDALRHNLFDSGWDGDPAELL